jgi:hypothetical protein
MSEDAHPYYYGCPERLLKQSTVEDKSGWREKNRRLNAIKKEFANAYKRIHSGGIKTVRFKKEETEMEISVHYPLSKTSFVGTQTINNKTYRFPMGQMLSTYDSIILE